MAKKMLIDATHAEETRVVVVDGNKVEEFDFESENKRQLAGNIYLAKVTRVEPSLQAAFVDYGGNRHGFLAFSEIHPDYYQIPVADREALMEEERAYAEAQRAREDEDENPRQRRRRGGRSESKAEKSTQDDVIITQDVADDSGEIAGMETIDLAADDSDEAISPMERVAETPVEEPEDSAPQATEAADAAAAGDDVPASDAHEEGAEDDGAEDGADEDGDHDAEADDAEADGTPARRGRGRKARPAERDSEIEDVSDDDDAEDIRPVRKPRPRRYKIQEVIKVRQIMLVQVVKEERGNKGAALTTYLSLAGRYCVLMPNTARGGGISRKITNAVDRKKLKEIAAEIDVPTGAGLIVRTAGAKRTKAEIKRDYEYLQRLWEQIRELTLKSIAPAKIYEEGDLIKRSIRDLYSRDIDEVLVEGERGYRIAKDFMKMIMPSHAVNVKQYRETLPLFARFQVESYLSSMFNPVVQLKSGGYIVIGVTEALVAIDVNSGRATKEGSIEETALKTNVEAAEEVARQLRLRDLAGLIVIDFIDMDERKNNATVEKRLKDKLKTDRARIQVGRISGFGLLEMSRQRLRPGMIEATTQPCAHCHGTGLIRSDDNLALSILRQIEEEGTRRRSREVLVKAPVGIANYLMNQKREHVAQIEGRYGLSVRIEGDPMLISPDFTMEKFKTATRVVAEVAPAVVSVDASLMDQVDDATALEDEDEDEAVTSVTTHSDEDGEAKPKRKRRRRRRSRGKQGGADEGQILDGTDAEAEADAEASADADAQSAPSTNAQPDAASAEDAVEAQADKPKKTATRSRSRSRKKADATTEAAAAAMGAAAAVTVAQATVEAAVAEPAPEPVAVETAEAAETAPDLGADAPQEKPAAKPRTRAKRTPKAKPAKADAAVEAGASTEGAAAETPAKAPRKTTRSRKPAKAKKPAADVATAPDAAPAPAAPAAAEAPVADTPAPQPAPAPAVEMAAPVAAPAPQPEDPAKPKRRGWWSRG
ncbi:MAG: ribonuclease E/G [Rhodobacteraceae bacterium]|nr:ribonuclease E/G [Paracoccaceae bacterium]